jgi:hypothetical protein
VASKENKEENQKINTAYYFGISDVLRVYA